MTIEARSENRGVIYPDNRAPDRGAVTIFAQLSCLNMQGTLAGSGCAVMAAAAIGEDTIVFKNGM